MEKLQQLRRISEKARLACARAEEERALLPEEGELYPKTEEKNALMLLREKLKWKKPGWKPFPWKSLSVRNLLIAGCAVLILLAAYLNLRFVSEGEQGQTPLESSGVVAEPNQGAVAEAEEDYFALAVINRERARDEAIDMYQALADNEEASIASRDAAFASMNALLDRTTAEIDIENAIKAKGFTQCVAILENEKATIIVESEPLSMAQVAQITEVVYLQANVLPQNLTITEKA